MDSSIGLSVHGEVSSVINAQDTVITWKDLSYIVKLKGKSKGLTKSILSNVNGIVRSGEMLAIMGPSGCGKTTILDALADKISTGELSGQILVNGEVRDQCFKRMASYVPEEEALMGVLTVRETHNYAADLTSGKTSKADRRHFVEATIDALGLRVCVDGRIGDIFFKGISGGQKRRVSIAIELLSQPCTSRALALT